MSQVPLSLTNPVTGIVYVLFLLTSVCSQNATLRPISERNTTTAIESFGPRSTPDVHTGNSLRNQTLYVVKSSFIRVAFATSARNEDGEAEAPPSQSRSRRITQAPPGTATLDKRGVSPQRRERPLGHQTFCLAPASQAHPQDSDIQGNVQAHLTFSRKDAIYWLPERPVGRPRYCQ
jgi:hypothetical protein